MRVQTLQLIVSVVQNFPTHLKHQLVSYIELLGSIGILSQGSNKISSGFSFLPQTAAVSPSFSHIHSLFSHLYPFAGCWRIILAKGGDRRRRAVLREAAVRYKQKGKVQSGQHPESSPDGIPGQLIRAHVA